jgi:thioester reductase-like protein
VLNEKIFLTGFPGFIAGRLVRCLAQERGAQFLLLVQPHLVAQARRDLARIAQETNSPASNFRIFEGDITQSDLCLSARDAQTVRSEATMLFHLAAVYDLAVRRDVAMRINLEGTRNVNHFSETIKNLRRYHYVSTCYVAGKREGLIRETELQHEAGFRNYYEETKYLAEMEVEELKARLPITIYRPSVVCGDSRTGETTKYDGIYYLIHYLRMQPHLLSLINIGNTDVRLNLVPVDFIVRAMAALITDERAIGATLQLADPQPLTSSELFDTIARAIAGHNSRLKIPAPLVRASLLLPFSPKLTGLPHAAVPYFFLSQTYDVSGASALLQPHGVRCPSFPSYVSNLVSFVQRHPKL